MVGNNCSNLVPERTLDGRTQLCPLLLLMPFEAQFDDLYRFGIKEPAAELGILAQRVDEQIFSEGILERIYRQIWLADIHYS